MDFLTKRASGVLLHPTALWSDYGIGDFGSSAYEFVDFLSASGQSFWQILPLGHTSFGDSPYQCQSAFAGNPLLISPEKLIELKLLDYIEEKNFDNDKVNFAEVIDYKYNLFWQAFERFKIYGEKELKQDFIKFCKNNKSWLDDYSFFIAYKNYLINERKYEFLGEEISAYEKDCYYGAAWNSWPEKVKKREKSELKKTKELLENDLEYYNFLQFIFDLQWGALRAYANGKGVSIIGDVPIFVALDSADVWANPGLFKFDDKLNPTHIAGVPPDYFSETGQLWGNPLYDWEAHRSSGYAWWIERIRHATAQVDFLRIDHFRGFEAHWELPYGEETAINGKWVKGPGREIFDAIKKELGKLPIIAEDLGIITPKVEKLRDALGFPGMKILQYSFDADASNSNKAHNFKSSNVICYTGTHDNDTSAGWYASQNEKTQDRFRRYMNVSGDDPSWDLIRLAALSTAVLSIYPVQDLLTLSSSDRFNTPGTSEGNWQIRIKKDTLSACLAERLKYLTKISDRLPDELVEEDD